jgi:hypothetical protein
LIGRAATFEEQALRLISRGRIVGIVNNCGLFSVQIQSVATAISWLLHIIDCRLMLLIEHIHGLLEAVSVGAGRSLPRAQEQLWRQ